MYRRLFLCILVVVAFVTTSKWCNLDAQDLDSIIFSGGGSWGGVINLQESTTYRFPYSTSSEQNSSLSPCSPTSEWLISQLPTTTPASISTEN